MEMYNVSILGNGEQHEYFWYQYLYLTAQGERDTHCDIFIPFA